MLSLTTPFKSFYHRIPPGPKFIILMIISIVLFLSNDILFHLGFLTVIIGLYLLPGRDFFCAGLKMLWPLWPFVSIVFVWHIMTDDKVAGVVIILRMFNAVALANLVTMTSRLDAIISMITKVARPLAYVGLKPKAPALAIALFIRFLPVLIDKGGRLIESWRSRSLKRAGWRVVVPMTLLALDDANMVAEALRARGGVALFKG